ncbi:MAG: TRAP transporter small permease subunit [Pseudomonadota bacterium]
MLARLERLAALWALAGGAVLLAIVAVTAANAAAFGLDKLARLAGLSVAGLPGYEDFVRLAIGAALPMFLPYTQARRAHLAVDFCARALGPRLNRWIERASLALTALAAWFLAYWMVIGMAETRADGVLSRVLGWPEWPFYAPGAVSLALWGAVALAQLCTEPAPDG